MSELRSLGFVVNPHAGRRKAGVWKSEIRATLDDAGVDCEIVETRDAHAVEDQVRSFAAKYDAVFAVGGDGTAHHVAQGLAGTSARFGLLPNGSGNDYSRMLGMPRGVRGGLELLLKGYRIESYNAMQLVVKQADSSEQLRRWSINTAGFGFDAAVSQVKTRIPVLKGIALYLTSSLVTLMTYKASRFTIDGVGSSSFKGLMVAAGVGEYEGGGFRIFPGASARAEAFHVCEVREGSTVKALPLLLKAVKGGHVTSPRISMTTRQEIVLGSDRPIAVHADGEVVSLNAVEVQIRLVPGALNVLVPA